MTLLLLMMLIMMSTSMMMMLRLMLMMVASTKVSVVVHHWIHLGSLGVLVTVRLHVLSSWAYDVVPIVVIIVGGDFSYLILGRCGF